MTLKFAVIELLRHGHGEEKEFLRELSSGERERIGSPEHPSAKVLLAHITEFKQQQVEKVAAAVSGAPPRPLEAVEPSDPAVYARLDTRSWPDIEEEAKRVSDDLVTAVERLSDDELRDAHRFNWLNGRPLCRQVLGRGLWHPLTHLGSYYRQHGQSSRSASLQRNLSAAAVRLDFVPAPGDGMSFYNLGCAFASAGERDKALAFLGEAVRTDAKYAGYAGDDPDLVTLRNGRRSKLC